MIRAEHNFNPTRTWATWTEDGTEHEVDFRPLADGEKRCDERENVVTVCCRLADHAGQHVAMPNGPAAMPFVIGP